MELVNWLAIQIVALSLVEFIFFPSKVFSGNGEAFHSELSLSLNTFICSWGNEERIRCWEDNWVGNALCVFLFPSLCRFSSSHNVSIAFLSVHPLSPWVAEALH